MKKEIRRHEAITKRLVTLSLLCAMSIVLGKYLAIPWGNILRFSLESAPILFAAFVYGPISALGVALVADLLGCLLVGYAINPLVTLGAAAIAIVAALSFRLLRMLPLAARVGLSAFFGHMIGSVLIKTLGLSVFYDIDLGILMLWRLLNYVIVCIMDVGAVYLLLKSPVLRLADGEQSIASKPIRFTYEDALAYIHGQNRAFCKPGLERVSKLLDGLMHPERSLACIHVAGTNGKGSTSSMLSSILRSAGYRVGLYTSPYILEFNERIQINGVNISNADLVRYTKQIRRVADRMDDPPTEFEIITAIAFKYFKDKGCDLVVLEVGLGGRFDATNIIEKPLLSIITGISLDHVAILGDTIEKIAYEKAGIIKPGCPILFGGGHAHAARSVIEEESKRREAPYYEVDRDALIIREKSLDGCVFDYNSLQNMRIRLLGNYQPYNASTAIDAVEILRQIGLEISESALREGLCSAKWPARFEILERENPLVIFDGGHNAEGISAAVESIANYFPNEKVFVLSGVLRDKDYASIARMISTVAERAFTITPSNPRALDSTTYASLLNYHGTKATAFVDEGIDVAFTRAYQEAKLCGRPLIVLGSLYTYGEVYHALERLREREANEDLQAK